MPSTRDDELLNAIARQLATSSTPLNIQLPHGVDYLGVLDDLCAFIDVGLRGTDPVSELVIRFRHAAAPDRIFVAYSGPLWTDADGADPMIDPSFSWDDNAETLVAWLRSGIYSCGLPLDEPIGTGGHVAVSWTLRAVGRGD